MYAEVSKDMLKTFVILGLLIAPLLLVTANAEDVKVEIAEGSKMVDNGKFYVPAKIVVSVGTTVEWKNLDDSPHTVTSGTATCVGQCWGLDFDSGVLRLDDVYRFTFDKPGTYPYLCSLHPWMAGTVTVLKTGQEIPVELSVKAVQAKYKAGDEVTIEGSVSAVREEESLMIQIFNPNNEVVASEPLVLNSDNTFSYSFKLADEIAAGSYTVKVSYGDITTESFFEVEIGENDGKNDVTPGEDGGTVDVTADVRVVAKQVRDLLLLRVKNADGSTASVYGITVETSGSVIEAFKGPRNWSNVDVSADVASSEVDDQPLSPGSKVVFKVKVNDSSFTVNWTAYDSEHNVLDQGEVNPIRR
jgi:plastocyanin